MTWILTITGREHNLASPPTAGYTLRELAHALSHINRFTGHTVRPYSVAEHSLLVAELIRREGYGPVAALCGLMHDAHEAICGDVPSPIKPMLGDAWEAFESATQAAVLQAFGLVEHMQDYARVIKHFDLVALATERRDLLSHEPGRHMPWPVLDTPGREVPPSQGLALMDRLRATRPPAHWASAFERRARELLEDAQGAGAMGGMAQGALA